MILTDFTRLFRIALDQGNVTAAKMIGDVLLALIRANLPQES